MEIEEIKSLFKKYSRAHLLYSTGYSAAYISKILSGKQKITTNIKTKFDEFIKKENEIHD